MELFAGFKSRLVSIAGSALGIVLSDIRGKILSFTESLPGASVKFYCGICVLSFLVMLAALGAVLLPAGLVLVTVQMAAEDVDSISLAGRILAWIGALYILIPSIVLTGAGVVLYGKVKNASSSISRKL